jgi:hypothetical protein
MCFASLIRIISPKKNRIVKFLPIPAIAITVVSSLTNERTGSMPAPETIDSENLECLTPKKLRPGSPDNRRRTVGGLLRVCNLW